LAEYVGDFVSAAARGEETISGETNAERGRRAYLNNAEESLKPSANARTASRALSADGALTTALRKANMARYRSNRCFDSSKSVVRREGIVSFSRAPAAAAAAAGAGSTVGKLGL
jgi:hypothetical protein